MQSIKKLDSSDRPRERLSLYGPKTLSDQDLLTLIIGSGSAAASVIELSPKVLKVIDSGHESLSVEDLAKIHGIGKAKACLICAALEFARRRIKPEGTKIQSPADAYSLLRHLGDRKQEHFICISLNGAHEVISIRTLTIGLVNSCQIHPREVFAEPICDRAAAIIIAHNHPSGQLQPSKEDLEITGRLLSAAAILGINLLDHVIFSRQGFLSLKESGNM